MDPQVILLAAAKMLAEGDTAGAAELMKDPGKYAEPDTTDQADDTEGKA